MRYVIALVTHLLVVERSMDFSLLPPYISGQSTLELELYGPKIAKIWTFSRIAGEALYLWSFQCLYVLEDSDLNEIPGDQSFPTCGGCTLHIFHTKNPIFIWLI